MGSLLRAGVEILPCGKSENKNQSYSVCFETHVHSLLLKGNFSLTSMPKADGCFTPDARVEVSVILMTHAVDCTYPWRQLAKSSM
jgi:hypothetical protein